MGIWARKWPEVSSRAAHVIREYLLDSGGQDAERVGRHEMWRIRLSGMTVTMYRSGTLYVAATDPRSPAASVARAFIDETAPPPFVPTDRTFLIGLDESGKSEVVGDAVLTGALVPRRLARDVETIVGLAKTKSKHPLKYWERLARALDGFRPEGFSFVIEKIPPQEIDHYNLNGLFDVTYDRILRTLLRRLQPETVRVVIDNYGLGGVFEESLNAARAHGAEVKPEARADDRFIEVRVASVIARHERERVVEAINADSRWELNGLRVGAGHANHADTLAWLNAWKQAGREWPSFIRQSSKPVTAIDGRPVPKKPYPPGHSSGS